MSHAINRAVSRGRAGVVKKVCASIVKSVSGSRTRQKLAKRQADEVVDESATDEAARNIAEKVQHSTTKVSPTIL